jgi:hypothetical protein
MRTNRLASGKRTRDEPTSDTEHSSPMYSMAFRVGVIATSMLSRIFRCGKCG